MPLRELRLADRRISDLSASADGRRIFVRERPAVHAGIAGDIVAYDAATLAEVHRLPLEPCLTASRYNPAHVEFTRHDPAGIAVFVVLQQGRTAQLYMFGDGRDGEDQSVHHCTSSDRYSDLVWHPTGGDYATVSKDQGVETSPAHTEWPDVHAQHAVLDDTRIAAIGSTELYVYDRVAGRERFRVAAGVGYAVALLPEGRVAALVGGRSTKLRIYDADGHEVLTLAAGAYKLAVSPTGLLALLGNQMAIVEPGTGREIHVGDGVTEFAWLDDHTAAVVLPGDDTLAVLDMRALIANGRVVKQKPAPKPKAVAAAGAPAPAADAEAPVAEAAPETDASTGGLKARTAAAFAALKKRTKPAITKAAGKLARFKELPASLAAYLVDAATIEAAWADPGAELPSKGDNVDSRSIRAGKPGQRFFLLTASYFDKSPYPPAFAADDTTLLGAKLTTTAFLAQFRPFAYFGERWFALALDGTRVVTAAQDMTEWTAEPRDLAQVIDAAFAFLAGT